MEELIYDLEKLANPSTPLKFLTDKGLDRTKGDEIISKLKEIMESDKNLVALAAPQIGIDSRIFCIRFDDKIKTFIDPIITKKSKNSIAPELCSFMPGKEILVDRPNEIQVVYYTDEYKYEDNKLLDAAARIFDQQCQLLDGILPSDIGLVSDIKEDGSLFDLTPEEYKEVLEFYKKFVETKINALNASVAEDEQEQLNQLKITEKIINGEVQIVKGTPTSSLNRSARRKLAKKTKHK